MWVRLVRGMGRSSRSRLDWWVGRRSLPQGGALDTADEVPVRRAHAQLHHCHQPPRRLLCVGVGVASCVRTNMTARQLPQAPPSLRTALCLLPPPPPGTGSPGYPPAGRAPRTAPRVSTAGRSASVWSSYKVEEFSWALRLFRLLARTGAETPHLELGQIGRDGRHEVVNGADEAPRDEAGPLCALWCCGGRPWHVMPHACLGVSIRSQTSYVPG